MYIIKRFNYHDKGLLIEIKIYGHNKLGETLLTLIIEINWIVVSEWKEVNSVWALFMQSFMNLNEVHAVQNYAKWHQRESVDMKINDKDRRRKILITKKYLIYFLPSLKFSSAQLSRNKTQNGVKSDK